MFKIHKKQNELHECQAFYKWSRLSIKQYPELQLLFHIPNGGQRSITTARKLKSMGTLPGIPDYCLPIPRQGYAGLWLEMKSGKGQLSSAQKSIIKLLYDAGHLIHVPRSAEEAINYVKEYLG